MQPKHEPGPPMDLANMRASLICVHCPDRFTTAPRRCVTGITEGVPTACHRPPMGSFTAQGRRMKMKLSSAVIAIVATFAGIPVARTEERLPLSELYPCEVVLHELIAQLRGLRAEAKRTSASIHHVNGEEDKLAAKELVLELGAWDEAIRLATKKFERCP
jgi:hypothetical protein